MISKDFYFSHIVVFKFSKFYFYLLFKIFIFY